MFNSKVLLTLTPLFMLFACSSETEQDSSTLESLEGSWRLKSYKDEGEDSWKQLPDLVIQEKYITSNNFTWIQYGTEKDTVYGTGGGTYIYDQVSHTYTEDIKFFLPAGHSNLGQSIPFDVRFENGKWYHTGYANVFEFDPDIGENVVVDTTKIEEIWERTNVPSSDESLVGTWQLESFKDHGDSIRTDYPEFVSIFKLVTPTHFVWIHYITEQDIVYRQGSGTYNYDGNIYTETLKSVYPSGSNQVGTVMPFESRTENDTWYLLGNIKRLEQDPDSGEMVAKDSARIDEVWKLFLGLGS
jgi:hypothetical protein